MNQGSHMGWRGRQKNYCWPGIYHITITVADRKFQPLGHIVGDVNKPDGDPQAPRVELSEVGKAVEQELLCNIKSHYPMVEVQDYVIMPDHLHFIVVVKRRIMSSNGRETHLGQIIAGFKKGCNRRYWQIKGLTADEVWQGKSAQARSAAQPTVSSPAVVYPRGYKVPSAANTGRPPLFTYGYVDVQPLREGQLAQQRTYIRNNPRYRLLRMCNRQTLKPQRGGINTALTLTALKGYLQRECGVTQFDADTWQHLTSRLLTSDGIVTCDTYGNCQLLSSRLLPVVCHRKNAKLFALQKERCLTAAANGATLVSARIAKGEQEIMNAAAADDLPIITIEDNGLPEIYHPSEQRTDRCAKDKLLIVTPWHYAYRHVGDGITVAECKTMNCVVQALCHTKDSWWQDLPVTDTTRGYPTRR